MVANLALFANIFFIMGVLASLHAVLTLSRYCGYRAYHWSFGGC
jgi:preprotein translocase subunit SecD